MAAKSTNRKPRAPVGRAAAGRAVAAQPKAAQPPAKQHEVHVYSAGAGWTVHPCHIHVNPGDQVAWIPIGTDIIVMFPGAQPCGIPQLPVRNGTRRSAAVRRAPPRFYPYAVYCGSAGPRRSSKTVAPNCFAHCSDPGMILD